MPKYDYKCISCGNIKEQSHRFDSNVEFRCERCGGDMVKQFPFIQTNMKGANSNDPITKYQFEHLWKD